eukprot:gene8684-biopygen10671
MMPSRRLGIRGQLEPERCEPRADGLLPVGADCLGIGSAIMADSSSVGEWGPQAYSQEMLGFLSITCELPFRLEVKGSSRLIPKLGGRWASGSSLCRPVRLCAGTRLFLLPSLACRLRTLGSQSWPRWASTCLRLRALSIFPMDSRPLRTGPDLFGSHRIVPPSGLSALSVVPPSGLSSLFVVPPSGLSSLFVHPRQDCLLCLWYPRQDSLLCLWYPLREGLRRLIRGRYLAPLSISRELPVGQSPSQSLLTQHAFGECR